jgi:predicted aspartyl protease
VNQRSSHNNDYFPSIPVLEVQLRRPDEGSLTEPLIALIDTGADITLVPQALLERMGALELDEVRLRSHWGEYTTVITYLVDLTLSIGTLPGIEVVGDAHGDRVLLGRNVLNKLILLIDGPLETTDLLAQRPKAA